MGKGKLVITVLGAKGYNTSTDAYVKIEVEDGSPKEAKTNVIKDNASPEWNQTFTFDVKKAKIGSHKVWVYVKDQRLIGGKEIGYCEFKYDDLSKFPSGQLVSLRDHKVDSKFGKTTATLSLDVKVTWE
eukprot:EG_transcript_36944